jgi:8-oxo-dGTP pyrophosphatase MutT (NUDIX family)
MSPWSTTASRILFADRWLRVRADDCVTSSGHIIKPFYVLDYPDWLHIVAVTPERDVVMIRQYRHGLGGTEFGLPAGTMDKTDTDPLAAAARELLEETGYRSADMRLVASLSPNTATHSNRAHIILALAAEKVAPQALDPSEIIAVELVPLHAVVERALTGEIHQSMHVAALMMALKNAGLIDIASR